MGSITKISSWSSSFAEDPERTPVQRGYATSSSFKPRGTGLFGAPQAHTTAGKMNTKDGNCSDTPKEAGFSQGQPPENSLRPLLKMHQQQPTSEIPTVQCTVPPSHHFFFFSKQNLTNQSYSSHRINHVFDKILK